MRVLRSTMWAPPADNGPPSSKDVRVTMVMREPDLKVSLEDARKHASDPLPGAPPTLITTEVFVVPDGTSIESATFEAHRRAEKRAADEKNMAIAFYYYVGALARVTDGGVMTATRPAPLDADDLVTVAEQLAQYPEVYRGHTVLQIARDWRFVRLAGGKVAVEAAPSR